jgi:DNA-directed RNA polymerase beta' subunit
LTNDILEFHEIFGIEATRNLIYKEVHKIFMESHPNPRHIQMLADTMTYRGKLMQIDRHGMNKNSEIGPIGKASFEEVMNIFTKAALFAEKDNMKGVSANIMTGQFCKAGTNTFDILVDEDKLMEVALDAGAEDVITHDDGSLEVLTPVPDFAKVQDAITNAGLKAELATVAMRPETEIALEGDQAESMQKLLDALENLDDVQEVFTNAEL